MNPQREKSSIDALGYSEMDLFIETTDENIDWSQSQTVFIYLSKSFQDKELRLYIILLTCF